MTKWQYANLLILQTPGRELGKPRLDGRLRIDRLPADEIAVTDPSFVLADLGEDGWELVSHSLHEMPLRTDVPGEPGLGSKEIFWLKRPLD